MTAQPSRLTPSLLDGSFEPVPEELHETDTPIEDGMSKEATNADSEPDMEFHEQYLADLWGSESASYFLHPVFYRSSRSSARRRRTLANIDSEPLILGGYPTGMLQGARIPFQTELSPWLFEPISVDKLTSSQSRRESMSRRLSTVSMDSAVAVMNRLRKPSSVFTLLDVLRLHAGGNPGAHRVWNFLRNKSTELLMQKERELEADGYESFAAFTREQVLAGDLKPPLCDFMRSNPSDKLAKTMTALKAPDMEKRFRQIQAMAKWAERNEEQFHTIAYQHDLREMLTDAELDELLDEYKQYRKDAKQWKIISQAEADQLRMRLPPLEQRKMLKPLEKLKPPVESFVSPNKTATQYGHLPPLTLQPSEQASPHSLEKHRFKSKPQMIFLQSLPISRRRGKSEAAGSRQTARIDQNKPKSIEPGQNALQRTGKTNPAPLCWSQLIRQYKCMSQQQLGQSVSGGSEADSSAVTSDRNSLHHYPPFKQGARGMWKPTNAVPT